MRERPRVLAVAHRGAALLARENTLPSLSAALGHGADAVEIDVKITANGRPVVVHDPTLDRLWELPLTVRETSYADLRARCPHAPDGIPDLADALRLVVPRAKLLIDVADTAIAEACLREIDALQLRSGVAFTGDPVALVAVRAERPDIELFFSWEEAEFPPLELLEAARPQYINQDATVLNASFVAETHRRGMRVCCYTVDDQHKMQQLMGLGVDAIISNDIVGLRNAIPVA